ncbi:hypothetical protein PVAG01_04818 [Phlyctema vagabunda]|uniref:DUF7708 domain-containing protein n=1 Tax=Phlyctema vagabunda TaxID=108571 RepID=A0ABR4PIA9_9HELO
MDSDAFLSSWDRASDQTDSFEVACKAFAAAKIHFEQQGKLSEQEKDLLSSAHCIEDVQRVVNDLLIKYEARCESSKTRRWLQKVAETISHYATVLDVFVQHHPEYVALVWGSMKLLFTGVVNHEETLKLLAKSVAQIAARLPRFKLVSKLYPTAEMRKAIETLYSCLLEFLIRAHGWCSESKIRHFYHSYTQPHELRYQDLLQRITDCSNNILELATVSWQVEIRVMHKIQKEKLGLIISLLETSGLTLNDLVAKTVSLYPRLDKDRLFAKWKQHSRLYKQVPS